MLCSTVLLSEYLYPRSTVDTALEIYQQLSWRTGKMNILAASAYLPETPFQSTTHKTHIPQYGQMGAGRVRASRIVLTAKARVQDSAHFFFMRSFLRNLSLSVLSRGVRRNLCAIGNSLPFPP